MNLSTWIKIKVFRMDVPKPKTPAMKLSEETVLLNGALQDLAKNVKEMNKRLGGGKVFDEALDAMHKEYRK